MASRLVENRAAPAAALAAQVVPARVATAETRRTFADAALLAEERRLLARATPGRRREFATGRACAREALRTLDIAPCAIAIGARGEPCWPRGVVGSITHREGFCAAAVARAEDVAALGIDAEPNAPLPRRLLSRLGSRSELEMLARERRAHRTAPAHADRLLFSAKEAAFKAFFALGVRALGLGEIEVSIDLGGGALQARAPRADTSRDGGLAVLSGRWCVQDGLLCVALALLRQPAPHPSRARDRAPDRCPIAARAPSARR
jgi:enterobactin synthetase component D / holo-[acyl-carrier protein] synthase